MSGSIVLGLLLALSIFFSGLMVLKSTLAQLEPKIGPWLRRTLGRPLSGVIIGCIITGIVQSSSAINAVVVSFVAAGVFGLPHAFSIMLGSNIGTTVTPQIAAYGTVEAGFALLTVGLMLHLVPRNGVKDVGTVLGGIGGIFIGLWAFGGVAGELSQTELGERMIRVISMNESGAVLSGAAFTAVVQSSSAVSSLLVKLADAGVLTARVAIAAVLGSNIGTVMTTMLAAVSGGITARRTALADLFFNVAGVLLVWPFFGHFVSVVSRLTDEPARQVAHAHTIFNILTVLIVLPWIGPFCRFIVRLTPVRKRR